MKAFLLGLLLIPSALAGETVLQPPRSPYSGLPFSNAASCHVQSIAADGNLEGVCHYYGNNPHNPGAYAIAEWTLQGAPVSAKPCVLHSTCPAQTFGAFEYLDGVPVFVQVVDGTTLAVIVDELPRVSKVFYP